MIAALADPPRTWMNGVDCPRFTAIDADDTSDVVARTMMRLRIEPRMHTSPKLLADILRTDMRLDDLASFTRRLGEKLTQPQSLQPLLGEISAGINKRHPLVKIFLSEALKAGLFPVPDDHGVKAITCALHHTYLLEALTVAMADDVEFTHEVTEHLLAKREEVGIRRTFFGSVLDIYRITRSVFSPAKAKTMDYTLMHSYHRLRESPPGLICNWKLQEKRLLLALNIVEAVCTDYREGEKNNAIAGVALLLNTITHIRIRPRSKFVENYFREDWATLYESWNLAFVVRNLTNPGIILPKLFIPCVINAEPENYLFNRGLSLWATVNFQLFARGKGVAVVMSDREPIAKLWGEVNRRYAERFTAQTRGQKRTPVL